MEDNLKGLEAEQMIVDDVSEITYKTIDLGEFGEVEIPEAGDYIDERIFRKEMVDEGIHLVCEGLYAMGLNLLETHHVCKCVMEAAAAELMSE